MSDDDNEIWDEFTRDVTPIEREIKPRTVPLRQKPTPSAPFKIKKAAASPVNTPQLSGAATDYGAGLDRRTADKLRKGRMSIDARIDLHGMSQDRAHHALDDFIRACHMHGHRCVLVITGKGKSGKTSDEIWERKPGILKQKVPMWLQSGALAPLVLRVEHARPGDGGEGALYVLLRRNKA